LKSIGKSPKFTTRPIKKQMKILKTILVLLLIVVVLAVIAMLVLPKKMEMTRTVVVDAPMSLTWDKVNSLRDMVDWSPWAERDPNQTTEFKGDDGAVGSEYYWKGNDDVGEGMQKIVAISPDSMMVDTDLTFLTPMESHADVGLKVEEADGKSKVSWSFETEMGMPGNLFMILGGMEGKLSKDFDNGLEKLKNQTEESFNELTAAIKKEKRSSSSYLVRKETLSMSEMEAYFQAKMPEYYGVAMQAGLVDTNRVPAAMYFSWDDDAGQSEMSIAIPVSEGEAPEGFEIVQFPAGECLFYDFYGPYEKTGAAHEALNMYIAHNKMDYRGPVMEEYVTDPGDEPDENKWLTRVVYPLGK